MTSLLRNVNMETAIISVSKNHCHERVKNIFEPRKALLLHQKVKWE